MFCSVHIHSVSDNINNNWKIKWYFLRLLKCHTLATLLQDRCFILIWVNWPFKPNEQNTRTIQKQIFSRWITEVKSIIFLRESRDMMNRLLKRRILSNSFEGLRIFGMCHVWLSLWQATLMLQHSDLKVLFGQRSLTNWQNIFLSISAFIFCWSFSVSVQPFVSISLLFCMQKQLLKQTYSNKLKFFPHKIQVHEAVFCPQSFLFYSQCAVHPRLLCNPVAIIHLGPLCESLHHNIPKLIQEKKFKNIKSLQSASKQFMERISKQWARHMAWERDEYHKHKQQMFVTCIARSKNQPTAGSLAALIFWEMFSNLQSSRFSKTHPCRLHLSLLTCNTSYRTRLLACGVNSDSVITVCSSPAFRLNRQT